MSWSYAPDQLSSSSRDQVRLHSGDTDASNPLVQDEEIDYLLTVYPNVFNCAAAVCDAVAANYRKLVTTAAGDVRVELSGLADSFLKQAATLRSQAARVSAAPYAGGISVADKQTQEDDADRVPPSFTRTLGDFPGAPLFAQGDQVVKQ